ncbi:poly(A) polymerase I isoform X2 [Ricinus communis]|uniref:poly(A) polymerase I isoform X2 n=1 Tax=Ricinus communis TaxID=3988 RepID=UPI000772A873|nr:poly(A) polymerase I isoform X2 [Ricinus communis]|eukprot:XP_015581210.1 uncharacterized protein LOC8275510 isoform X2 [Ricinus communis]
MAITGLSGFACRPHFSLRPPFFHCIRKARYGAVVAIETLDEPEPIIDNKRHNSELREGDCNGPKWKKLNSKELGITNSMIASPTRKILNGLKQRGYEVYLVGGCVRDLILKRIPKDFDIITSAELREVARAFSRCEIVGRRFPICHVYVGDTVVEVSSFSTTGQKFGGDWNYDTQSPIDCDEKDYMRWRNCSQRDFTINGLMFDPYEKIVYDYIGGLEDIRKAKVRTVTPASNSFQEDCARILRAVRIAARLGFRFSRETAHFLKHFAHSILRLDKGRLLMEMNYMLAYGSSEASLRLLWKFGLLEILLPIQAAYFVHCGFKRRDKRSNMLLSLLSNMDKLLAPDRPCHSCLWIGILAFHKALSEQPRDPLVVAAFCLAVHNGGDMSEAVNIAKRIDKPHDMSFHELCKPGDMDTDQLVDEVMDLAQSIKRVLSMMTDEHYVSQAMAEYPQAPYSDLVFISFALYLRVGRVFECVRQGKEKGFVPKQGGKINYQLLALGSLKEVRHTFARIVFDTVYPLNLT